MNPRFLLAPLHIEALTREPTIGHVESALQGLPRELDETYKQAVTRIQSQGGNVSVLAENILCWVIHARRVLSIGEIRHALAIQLGKLELDDKFIPSAEMIGSVCAGLVTIDKGSDTVRLVHYTAQVYFERAWAEFIPAAHTNITKLCLTYLSFSVFDSGFCETYQEFERRLQANRFYDYAARNWGYHAYGASSDVEGLILQFLERHGKRSSSAQVIMSDEDDYCFRERLCEPPEMTGLHLAAYFGLWTSIIALFNNGHRYDADVKDSHGRTPLWLAAKEGHEKVVRLLLESGADPNVDNEYGSPLSLAVDWGHYAVVKLLLENGADLDDEMRAGTYTETPLGVAAQRGDHAMLKLLLENGADPDAGSFMGETLLWLVIKEVRVDIGKLLLESGADTETTDGWGKTPLLYAVKDGCESRAKLMLGHAAGIPAGITDIQRLLVCAAKGKLEAICQLLFNYGADIEAKDTEGKTPLLYAAEYGCESTAKLLLDYGADIEVKLTSGQTPLIVAVQSGHQSVVKLLLDHGADIEAKDIYGQTSLIYAAKDTHTPIFKLLLDHGADIEANNTSGQTPLLCAAKYGRKPLVELLIDKGARIEARDNYSQTSLMYAVRNRHELTVKLLLDKSADIEAKDDSGRTPLSYSIRDCKGGGLAMLLMDNGADIEAKDNFGQTPLSWAAECGSEARLEDLLENNTL